MCYDAVLKQVRRELSPPETVILTLSDGIIEARGTAPPQWIAEARKLARLVPGVRDYRDDGLGIDQTGVVARIKLALAPPETVTLTLRDGELSAKGMAPYQWVMETRKLVRLIPEVTHYEDEALTVNYDLVLEALTKRLSPPGTVKLAIDQGVLWADGSAPHQWIVEARRLARVSPEISGYRDERVRDIDGERFKTVKAAIEMTSPRFEKDTDRLIPGQEDLVSGLLRRLTELQGLARELDKQVSLTIKGHTDSMGTESRNLSLSHRRAEKIASLLSGREVRWIGLAAEGVGASEPLVSETSESERASNRRVSFVVVSDDGARPSPIK